MLPAKISLELQDKEIIIDALKFLLDDMEEERKTFSTTSEVIKSGIMDGINSCRETLKVFQRDIPLSGQNVYDIHSALSAYLDFSEFCISNSTAQEKNFALDLRKNIKSALAKFKPIYDYLMAEHN